MAGVTISGAGKFYGKVETLRSVSIEIPDGQFVVLVGPSGCGKSTLLRMIAGLEGISSGEIRIGGRLVNDLAPKDRDIAMVFQNYALYPHMTVAENMSFSLELKGVPKDQREAKIRGAAEILGLESLLARYPRQLSGGQRQRVAMGRAIVRDPQVFLFDEPLSNLDAKLRVQMRAEIKSLHRRLKTTTIYVTHDQVEAMTMADRIVIMRDGVVEQTGSPLDLYDRPANVFVGGFIGSPAMNFLQGAPRGREFVLRDGTALPLAPPDGAATIGIRPEHVTIDPAGMPAQVVSVEPTGAETQVILTLGDQTLTVTLRDRIPIQPEDVVSIKPDAAAVHFFDARGERLR